MNYYITHTQSLHILVIALLPTLISCQLNCSVPDTSWLTDCVGFSCVGVNFYRHNTCCVRDFTEAELTSCVDSGDYRHIIFPENVNQSRVITLTSKLLGRQGVILDGGRDGVTLVAGKGIELPSYSILRRVILRDVVHDYTIKLLVQSSNAWIHQCVFTNITSGVVIDTNGGYSLTISWSRFDSSVGNESSTSYVKVYTGTRGVQSRDSNTRITVHHNYFHTFRDAAPSVRYGYAHIYNNVYDTWFNSAVKCTDLSKCLIESNLFSSSHAPSRNIIEVDSNGGVAGNIRSVGNVMLETGGREPNVTEGQVPAIPYAFQVDEISTVSAGDFRSNILSGLLSLTTERSDSAGDTGTTTILDILSTIYSQFLMAAVTLVGMLEGETANNN